MEQLRVREHRESGIVVLAVSGELDVATGPQLDCHLAALTTAGHNHVILNAADLAFCDACGLAVLLRGHTRARAQHGWLRLVAAHPRVRRVLAITALTRQLPVFDTVADAIADMTVGSPPSVTSPHHAASLS